MSSEPSTFTHFSEREHPEYNRLRMRDIIDTVQRAYAIGDRFTVHGNRRTNAQDKTYSYRILEFYPHHILTVREDTGFRSSFTYLEFYGLMHGEELQDPWTVSS